MNVHAVPESHATRRSARRVRAPAGHEALTLAGFIAATVLVVSLVVVDYWVSGQHTRAAGWVSHTHEVLASLANARAAAVDIQNGPRGFVISGAESDLAAFDRARAALGPQMDRLRALLADDPAQRERLAELDRALAQRIATAQSVVTARRTEGFDGAKRIIDSDAPSREMMRIRGLFAALESEEQSLLAGRIAEHEVRLAWFWRTTTALVLVLLGTLALLHAMMRRSQRQHAALLQSEQRFHLMTQSVVDYAIVMLDPAGFVMNWNAGAARIKGWREHEIVGRHFSCFYRPEDAAAGVPDRMLDSAREMGRAATEDWRVRKDGSIFWATVVVTPIHDGDGTLTGFVKVTRDLSERKRHDEALRAEMRERRRIDDELKVLNRSLERMVDDRTAALAAANAELTAARARLQDLSGRLIAAQEEERRALAQELHDETAQALTGIKLRLHNALANPADSRHSIEESVTIVDRTVAQIRNMAVSLRPLLLDDLGLADALQWALEEKAKAAGWEVTLDVDDMPVRLPPMIETACFRIGQEALTNVARHAGARRVALELHREAGELALRVRDDGAGFDAVAAQAPELRQQHFGLVSMAERANLVGGRFEISSVPGAGTSVIATFPLPAHAAAA